MPIAWPACETLESRTLLSASSPYVSPSVPRVDISLDSSWRFHRGDVRPVAIGEYGAGASIYQHTASTAKVVAGSHFHPEEYQSLFHEAYWAAIQTRPWIWGKFVWSMFDFASDSRDEGDTARRNDKGLVTFDRQVKKDAFYFYIANWWSDPVLYITDRRFTQRTDPTTDVKIYSNCDTVTLSVNGVEMGTLISPNRIFTWSRIGLSRGDNTVQVSYEHGGQTYTNSCVWTL